MDLDYAYISTQENLKSILPTGLFESRLRIQTALLTLKIDLGQ